MVTTLDTKKVTKMDTINGHQAQPNNLDTSLVTKKLLVTKNRVNVETFFWGVFKVRLIENT